MPPLIYNFFQLVYNKIKPHNQCLYNKNTHFSTPPENFSKILLYKKYPSQNFFQDFVIRKVDNNRTTRYSRYMKTKTAKPHIVAVRLSKEEYEILKAVHPSPTTAIQKLLKEYGNKPKPRNR